MPTPYPWIITTQSRPLPGCEIAMDGCEFYFADAFFPVAPNGRVDALVEAIGIVNDALKKDKLELTQVLFCAQFKPEEWVDKSGSVESLQALAARSVANNCLVFSSFRSEEIQKLYCYTYNVRDIGK